MIRQLLEALFHREAFGERKLLQRSRERWLEEKKAEDKQRHKKERDDEEFTGFLLLSDSLRRAYSDLARDIDDAITATRLAYNKAVKQEELTREALEDVQRHAIVLPNGRRVFFSRDQRLYGEDCREITDAANIADATRILQDKRDAPTFETYAQTYAEHQNADARVQQLSTLLTQLDELKELQRAEALTPDALLHGREELERILNALPPDVRAEFDGMQTAKTHSSPASAAVVAAPVLQHHFAGAEDAFAKQDAQTQPNAETAHQLSYKHIPDF